MAKPAQAMVVLASEQIWPNIHGLVHWHRYEGGLSDLCIYHTEDENRSRIPAERLAHLCRELYGDAIRIHFPQNSSSIFEESHDYLSPTDKAGHPETDSPGNPIDTPRTRITPQAVREEVRRWHAELPGRRWIVNATGGTKLMFSGALECIRLPDTQIVYRELGERQWYQIEQTADGLRVFPISISPGETDEVPVKLLLTTQAQMPQGGRWDCSKPQRLPLKKIVEAGIQTQWDWQKAFAACGLQAKEYSGFLFEKFVAATLLELGISNVVINAKWSGPQDQVMQEIDIVANHRGRLLIIDCKLRSKTQGESEATVAAQIRQAAATCRQLGGLSAELLLLRPGRILSEEERTLADAFRLKTLDARKTSDFFREIADFCGYEGQLPAELQAAQDLLDQAKQQGAVEAFASTQWTKALPTSTPLSVILPVGSSLEKLMRDLGQDWIAYQVDALIFFRVRLPAWITEESNIRLALERWFYEKFHVKLVRCEVSRQKTHCLLTACLARPKDLRALKEQLAKCANRSIFE
ncbi:MAG: hypothetical protein ACUVQH_14560 [Thermogutta sp.]